MADEGEGHNVEAKEGCKPMQASAFRKGTCIILKDKPCKVVDMSTSKTGKHGHAKVNFTGIDIFTGKKYKEIQGSTHNMLTFESTKEDWGVMDLQSDTLSLINDAGDTKDVGLPPDEELAAKIQEQWDAHDDDKQEMTVTLMTALGQEQVTAWSMKDRKD
jgi:translation initiation factor 5A